MPITGRANSNASFQPSVSATRKMSYSIFGSAGVATESGARVQRPRFKPPQCQRVVEHWHRKPLLARPLGKRGAVARDGVERSRIAGVSRQTTVDNQEEASAADGGKLESDRGRLERDGDELASDVGMAPFVRRRRASTAMAAAASGDSARAVK